MCSTLYNYVFESNFCIVLDTIKLLCSRWGIPYDIAYNDGDIVPLDVHRYLESISLLWKNQCGLYGYFDSLGK